MPCSPRFKSLIPKFLSGESVYRGEAPSENGTSCYEPHSSVNPLLERLVYTRSSHFKKEFST